MICSVVLPYYDNQRTLAACLQALVRQTLLPREIVVVDDESPEAALPIAAALAEGPGEAEAVPGVEAAQAVRLRVGGVVVRCLRVPRGGQSAATNAGIVAARGDLLLLTCGDIVPHRDWVAQHVMAHRDGIAVLGDIPYADNVPRTPFIHYLSQPGPQFCFAWITDPERVSPKYCYSPNLSVARQALLDVGLFDASFRYGYQDTDLGMRLDAAGVRLVYRSAAIAYHDHPTDVCRFAQRQRVLADGTLRMLEKYPDAGSVQRLRGMVQHYRRYIARLPAMLSDVERRELQLANELTPHARQQLHQLYDFVLTLALVDGILQQPERAHPILFAAVPPEEAQPAERLRPCPPDA